MDQVHVVRHKVLVEGRSQRAVARELGIARVTVRKYLEQAAPVRRPEAAARRRPVWEAVSDHVLALLTESVQWTSGKQQLTATRLHELLLAEGHRVGVTVIKQAVAERKRQRRWVFVPLTYRPGDLAEVDFFEVLVDIDGTRRKAWLFLMRLMYSGPRLCVDLRAAGPDQLPRGACPRLCAFRRGAGSRGLRQSPGGRRPDPRGRRTDVDAPLCRARLPLLDRGLLLSARRGSRQGRRRVTRQSHSTAGTGADPERRELGGRQRGVARPHGCAPRDETRCDKTHDRPALYRGAAGLAGGADPLRRREHDGRNGVAAGPGPLRGRRVLGAVPLGGPRSPWYASALLVVVSVTACFVPARKAANLDPLVVLRYE